MSPHSWQTINQRISAQAVAKCRALFATTVHFWPSRSPQGCSRLFNSATKDGWHEKGRNPHPVLVSIHNTTRTVCSRCGRFSSINRLRFLGVLSLPSKVSLYLQGYGLILVFLFEWYVRISLLHWQDVVRKFDTHEILFIVQ